MKAMAVLAAILAGGCVQVSEVRNMSWPAEPGSVLSVSSFNGEVAISETESDSICVVATLSSWLGQDELEKVEIGFTPGLEAAIIARPTEAEVGAGVSLDVTVPMGTVIGRVSTSNGSIGLDGLQGDAVLTSSNGGIYSDGFTGSISASTSNGDITIGNLAGSLAAETSNGDIVVEGDDVLLEEASTSNGEVVATVTAVPAGGLTIETSNAGVTLIVSGSFPAEFRMDTSNGDIQVNGQAFTVIELDDNEGTAAIGEGGPVVIIDTSNASILLKQL